jgi:hypothetical protein
VLPFGRVQEYFQEIEAHFAARRGTPFILSAKDWALMKLWADEGIPLPVVIEAIDSVFEKAAERRKVVSSLSYCKHAVKELWAERKDLRVGDAEAVPEQGPEEQLAALASSVERIDAAAAEAIRALAAEKNVSKVEESLIAIEGAMIERLSASMPAEELAALRREIAAGLAGLDDKTRARTEEANLRRMIREKFALPRLTLFG